MRPNFKSCLMIFVLFLFKDVQINCVNKMNLRTSEMTECPPETVMMNGRCQCIDPEKEFREGLCVNLKSCPPDTLDIEGKGCVPIPRCKPGDEVNLKTATCQKKLLKGCPPGTLDIKDQGCVPVPECDLGYEVDSNTAKCILKTCKDGYVLNKASGDCEVIALKGCPPGTLDIKDQGCVPVPKCNEGEEVDNSTAKCVPMLKGCPPWTNDVKGQGCVPKTCELGFEINKIDGSCNKIECASGYDLNVKTGICEIVPIQCDKGFVLNTSTGKCQLLNLKGCPPGTINVKNRGCIPLKDFDPLLDICA